MGNVEVMPWSRALLCAVFVVCNLHFIQLGRAIPLDLEPAYFHRNWKPEHGLPDNRAYDVLETREGYLWIATTSGLARFDGRRFSYFNPVNTPEMLNDDCIALAEDGAGNLWIATQMGLLRRDGAGRFNLRRIEKYLPNDGVHLFAPASPEACGL